MKIMKLFVVSLFFFASSAFALAPSWTIDPAKSSLCFTATQNNAPVNGSFKNFTTQINFDPDNLKDSKVKVVVNVGSVSTSYEDLTATLVASEWFNTKVFPQAIFESESFEKTGENAYKAHGTLTLKGKSLPVDLYFTADQPDANHATVKGYCDLKRTAFNVGEGEWSKDDEVKDIVRVDFVLEATRDQVK